MRAGIAVAAALLVVATGAPASPTGTPQANAPRDGKGMRLDLPFGHRHEAVSATVPAAAASGGAVAPPAPPRRHLTQAEWRRAYITRHGHDIQAVAHPGH